MAASQLSPGVVIQERDFTTVSLVALANIGALAARLNVDLLSRLLISTMRELSFPLMANPTILTTSFGLPPLSSRFMVVLKTIRADGTLLKMQSATLLQ